MPAFHFSRKLIPALFSALLLLAASVLFLALLYDTKMLPARYLCAGIPVCLLAAAAAFFLMRRPERRVRFLLGLVWTILCTAFFLTAGYFVRGAQDTVVTITEPKEELSEVSFYVKTGDPAWSLSDAASYTFGILKLQDRESTDAALLRVREEQGLSLAAAEFDSIEQLADALRAGTVGGIVLNQAYLSLYGEQEGYSDFPSEIRALTTESLSHPAETARKEEPAEAQEGGSVINLYISGSDTREDTLPVRTRSDVNIIASINTAAHEILLLSTPRDYYVPLSISGGVPDKLTHAGIYGVDVSIETLEMLYGIEIPCYFRVNFTGFVDIIDALGGITVESDYAFTAGDYTFSEGSNTLDGEAALAFCRERYSFSEGDRQRGKNQMAVIRAVIRKAASPAILTGYSKILESVQDCIQTNVPYDLIAELVRDQLSDGADWKITAYSTDGYGDHQIPYSMSSYAYVMVPDTDTVEHAKELLRQVAGEAS